MLKIIIIKYFFNIFFLKNILKNNKYYNIHAKFGPKIKEERKVKKGELNYIFCHYQMFNSYLNNIKFESYPYSF
jgi:hypothetical protein